MKKLFAKWLSALLIAALLLCSVALMEETAEEVPADSVWIGAAASEPSEAADAPEEVASEAVDEDVAEETDVELDDQSLFEARSESEVLDLVPPVSHDGEYEQVSMPLMAASTSSFDVISIIAGRMRS